MSATLPGAVAAPAQESGGPGGPRPGRGTRRGRLALGVGVVVVGLCVGAAVRSHGGRGPGPVAAPATVGGAAPAAAEVFEAPTRRVVLPAGSTQVDEYPVSFPHSPEGAAAAAVALTRYSASVDFATVSEVLRLYTSPAAGAAADAAAAAATTAARARLGVGATGPAPGDAAVFAEPFAVRWLVQGPDRVVVSVLSSVEYRTAQRSSRELVAVGSQWSWDTTAADWRVLPGAVDAGAPSAEIGSAAFNRAGWVAVAERRQ